LQTINVRTQPSTSAPLFGQIPVSTVMNVLGQERNSTSGQLWFRIEAVVEGFPIQGYVSSNSVTQLSTATCPPFPG
jgi:hypothetical protein